jgi:hypothetical protein
VRPFIPFGPRHILLTLSRSSAVTRLSCWKRWNAWTNTTDDEHIPLRIPICKPRQ